MRIGQPIRLRHRHQRLAPLWGGGWDAATRDLQEFLAITEASGDLQALRNSHGLLAELDIAMGRPAAAHDRLLPLLDRPDLQETDVTRVVLPTLAWACLELGEVARAEDLAQQAVRRARTEGTCLRLQIICEYWRWWPSSRGCRSSTDAGRRSRPCQVHALSLR